MAGIFRKIRLRCRTSFVPRRDGTAIDRVGRLGTDIPLADVVIELVQVASLDRRSRSRRRVSARPSRSCRRDRRSRLFTSLAAHFAIGLRQDLAGCRLARPAAERAPSTGKSTPSGETIALIRVCLRRCGARCGRAHRSRRPVFAGAAAVDQQALLPDDDRRAGLEHFQR